MPIPPFKVSATREPRLVLRFALASLMAFVLVGVGAMFLMIRDARDGAELAGARHAIFVGRAVLAPALDGVDLSRPLRGTTYRALDKVVHQRILAGGDAVRVKIWRMDGTIVFSDQAELVGDRFPEEIDDLKEVARGGEVLRGISDLDEEENTFERDLADKLFFTYAPLRLEPGGPVVAVAEIYRDYRFIQDDIDAAVRQVAGILVAGLAVLYALMLPIAFGASRELRKRNERLNELLQHEQLTVIELRDYTRKKDDFVSAVSHELRTPLTTVSGILSTLRRPDLGEDPVLREELLGAAARQAKRLERLVDDILAAGDLGNLRPAAIEPMDLSVVVEGVARDLEVTDRIDIDVPSGIVETDRTRIAAVLTYLVDNAVKYSPADTKIDVGASVQDGGFRVWVTDRGEGIDPAEHDAIFERFHQVDQSSTRSHGGLGLGLHLATALVRDLGGAIEVASAPGRGSTFTVVVPGPAQPEIPAAPVTTSVAWS